ncbi:hypothetical protein K431DRAFT_108320 [Polychaeton citri CBS 116435]|uniref:Uncharacterized protein n=1 Tax=Polychaeton citri CBS 116435 TaxID=1314669 RepID=A0A9P4UML3_9PEZI|nr:hypothetical protein K431DRAFT_108320 [Polychaeton citri CBS 116435]
MLQSRGCCRPVDDCKENRKRATTMEPWESLGAIVHVCNAFLAQQVRNPPIDARCWTRACQLRSIDSQGMDAQPTTGKPEHGCCPTRSLGRTLEKRLPKKRGCLTQAMRSERDSRPSEKGKAARGQEAGGPAAWERWGKAGMPEVGRYGTS